MMVANVISLIGFRKTNDGRTQDELQNEIKKMVHGVNSTNDTDERIADFIIKSFSTDGIIETYNQLGRYGWHQMILQMVRHEVWERKENRHIQGSKENLMR